MASTDNNEQLIFISHAAMDEEIARVVKEAIRESFPSLIVFVSSDPEDLAPGDPWVEKVLEALHAARVMLVLITSRSLRRVWVWFEAGAAWRSRIRLVPCCIGAPRKAALPAPFSNFQGLNLDTPSDGEALFLELEREFGAMARRPKFSQLSEELIRLDVRLDERQRILREGHATKEMHESVENGLAALSAAEKEAVRLLFIEGDLTDRRAVELVRQKNLHHDSSNIFTSIAAKTNFVQRVWPKYDLERISGYEGPWTLNPHLKDLLEDKLFRFLDPG